jgi:hypothetical protein
MAAPLQGLPVRLDRAPQRGAAFAITRASRRARTRSIGSRSRASDAQFRPGAKFEPLHQRRRQSLPVLKRDLPPQISSSAAEDGGHGVLRALDPDHPLGHNVAR